MTNSFVLLGRRPRSLEGLSERSRSYLSRGRERVKAFLMATEEVEVRNVHVTEPGGSCSICQFLGVLYPAKSMAAFFTNDRQQHTGRMDKPTTPEQQTADDISMEADDAPTTAETTEDKSAIRELPFRDRWARDRVSFAFDNFAVERQANWIIKYRERTQQIAAQLRGVVEEALAAQREQFLEEVRRLQAENLRFRAENLRFQEEMRRLQEEASTARIAAAFFWLVCCQLYASNGAT
uniref:Uncharacterized protein n=1 Tax=Globodera rostochiensis TaxID=31243 RepID=A0A914I9C1_GLORO